jgi:hypothetical protein
MTARLFLSPFFRGFSTAGAPASGDKLYFYLSGGTTATPAYTSSALVTQHPNPVVADSAGRFPAIYLDDSVTYRVRHTDSAGTTIADVDPYTIPVPLDAETVRDAIAAFITAGDNITITHNDAANTLEIDAALEDAAPLEHWIIPITDTATAVGAGVSKYSFRAPFAITLPQIPRATLATAQTGSGAGGIITVDINDSGSSILSTKLTIDNGETSSSSAATPAVLSDSAIADDALITIDVDQIGDGTAKGLNIIIYYRRA